MRLAALVFLLTALQDTAAFRVVCVYTNWAQYRADGGKFLPEDVDPALCTHVIYVYAKLKGNKLASVEWNDDGNSWSEGMYDRVNNLKQINPDMKTLLGVGGWNMGSKDFSKMASGRIYRRMFARSAVKFLRDRKFDGLTIDWQHPTKRGGRPRDRINFSLLLQEIRRAFDDDSNKTGLPALLLTAGVSASQRIIEDAYEVDNITKYTDFINVFAYDLHGSWENFTGHPSQLYARDEETGPLAELNVDASMRYWMSHVPDRSKLVLGLSTSGRTFTLADPLMNGVYAPAYEPGLAGEFTQQPGMLAYYERCFQYADATRVWDDTSKSAYWYSGDQWIAGEDEESIKAKVFWSRRQQIGGVMLSSLAMDDFKDKCFGGKFTLLQTTRVAITEPLPELPSTEIPHTQEVTTATSMKKVNSNMKVAAKEVVEKTKDESVAMKENQPNTANVGKVKPKPIQNSKLKKSAQDILPKKGNKGKATGGAPGNRKQKRRKRPIRRRLTPEQRRRLIRRKMKNHKGKVPVGWGKMLNIKNGKKVNQEKKNKQAVGSKQVNAGDKTNPKPKQEVVTGKKENAKSAVATKTVSAVKTAKDNSDKQVAASKSNQGNKPNGQPTVITKPNNNKKGVNTNNKKGSTVAKGKTMKINRKGRVKMLKRKGLGFKRKFKFKKGPGAKNRRRRKPVKKNGPKKAAA